MTQLFACAMIVGSPVEQDPAAQHARVEAPRPVGVRSDDEVRECDAFPGPWGIGHR
jgi:hypothetical protein